MLDILERESYRHEQGADVNYYLELYLMALSIFKALLNGKEIIKTMCHEEHVIARIKFIQSKLLIRDQPIESEIQLTE